ncbi:MAG: 50S ribosomal protein L15 [Brevinematia bacterium]
MLMLKRPKYVKKSIRKGIGISAGKGKTAGRGGKGQTARGKGKVAPYFEGGQTPLYRRLPKRGFNNSDKVDYEIVNIGKLNVFSDGDEVSVETLKKHGLVKGRKPIKILGDGELKVKNLKIAVHKVSSSAKEKLEKMGATVTLIS